MWGALSDERTGLSFTIAAGPHQRSHSRVRVLWDSRTYFTVSDWRLPFSSPPTILRVTVEVFDTASTQDLSTNNSQLSTDNSFTRTYQKTVTIVVEACVQRRCIATALVCLFRGIFLANGLYITIFIHVDVFECAYVFYAISAHEWMHERAPERLDRFYSNSELRVYP
jgi:hypothetical protein